MTANKALELLKLIYRPGTCDTNSDLYKANQIGIEALQLNLSMRETYEHPELLVLPSEEPE